MTLQSQKKSEGDILTLQVKTMKKTKGQIISLVTNEKKRGEIKFGTLYNCLSQKRKTINKLVSVAYVHGFRFFRV